MSVQHFRRHILAPRSQIYRALLDPEAVARWRVPDGMTFHAHTWEPWEGGTLRVSLTYQAPTSTGKTTAQTDTYYGRFEKLVPDTEVVEIDEFETANPTLQGAMKTTFRLTDAAGGGTDLIATHEGLPPGVSRADNETGWAMALAKLAALVEAER